MHKIAYLLLCILALTACSANKATDKSDYIIDKGQMPNLTIDNGHKIHLVYGRGDSILYRVSSDNGSTFSTATVIAVVPHVYSFAMRGPQIASTKKGLVVTACTSSGDIFSFYKETSGPWRAAGRVNDVDTVVKEGLMALDSDAGNVYAVWLDTRGDKHNKVYGAHSSDGGKTWSANVLVYASPDTTVCECCKPSVRVKGNDVYVMFRNQLNGNRDMYLSRSSDEGKTFAKAQKLGTVSWALNACPMDGGGLAINNDGTVATVWRREGAIYASSMSGGEMEIGEGKQCTLETINNKQVYAWIEKGNVIIVNQHGQKKIVGQGSIPILKTLDSSHVFCVWEKDKQVHASVVEI